MTRGDVRGLLSRWEDRDGQPWTSTAAGYRDLARDALSLGHAILASEVLREALAVLPPDAELTYLAALANARIGCWQEAAALVAPLLDDASLPDWLRIEARSLAGRIAKDRWARSAPGSERDGLGAEAVAHYRVAWDDAGDPFPGINAATLTLLTGDDAEAQDLARAVRERASHESVAMAPHWREATLGEAAVLLRDYGEATLRYRAAAAAASGQFGHVAAMRRQLKLLAQHRSVPDSVLDALRQPNVVAFTGRTIGFDDRSARGVAGDLQARLATAIAEAIDELGAGFGYCSAAAGPDILFIEAMLARGAEVHIVLPFEREDFLQTSVAPAGVEWPERFERALAEATSVTYAVREGFLGDEALFGYADTLARGATVLRARELEIEPVMLALIDSAAEPDPALAAWLGGESKAKVIDLRGTLGTSLSAPAEADPILHPAVAVRATQLRRSVKTMLFADVVGFSRLGEEATPAFVVEFLGSVAEIVEAGTVRPEFVNTWGDGLFMVFDDVAQAADSALRLRDAVLHIDWPARGIPAGTSVRVGMHSGPVFPAEDPLIGRGNFFGSHVNRAARIEPVAAPGTIYVSEAMACLLAASGGNGFTTDYLGATPLAKGFDFTPLYRLRRADSAE